MEQQTLSSVTIRPITAADDPFIAKIIRTNFEQYHLTIPGTAYFDPELDHLRAFYSAKPGRGYFVAVGENGTVLGGCGFAETAVFDAARSCKSSTSPTRPRASASADVCPKPSSRPPETRAMKRSTSRRTPNSTPPSASTKSSASSKSTNRRACSTAQWTTSTSNRYKKKP